MDLGKPSAGILSRDRNIDTHRHCNLHQVTQPAPASPPADPGSFSLRSGRLPGPRLTERPNEQNHPNFMLAIISKSVLLSRLMGGMKPIWYSVGVMGASFILMVAAAVLAIVEDRLKIGSWPWIQRATTIAILGWVAGVASSAVLAFIQ